jgi:hypothetical protein
MRKFDSRSWPEWSDRYLALRRLLVMRNPDVSVNATDPDPNSGDFQPYDEATFLYFLEMERRRAEPVKRALLLALVGFAVDGQEVVRVDAATSKALIAALASCVREVDFIGWYRANSIAGAVMPQPGNLARSQVSHSVGERIALGVSGRLPPDLRNGVEVRVLQLQVGEVSRNA